MTTPSPITAATNAELKRAAAAYLEIYRALDFPTGPIKGIDSFAQAYLEGQGKSVPKALGTLVTGMESGKTLTVSAEDGKRSVVFVNILLDKPGKDEVHVIEPSGQDQLSRPITEREGHALAIDLYAILGKVSVSKRARK